MKHRSGQSKPKGHSGHGNEHARHHEDTSHKNPIPASSPVADETIYTCPMHPEVRQNQPGNCPKCGMFLEPMKSSDNGGGSKASDPGE